MKFVTYFLLYIQSLFAHQCLFPNRIQFELIYLCRERLNSTSIRVWLYLNFNQTNRYHLKFFSSYTFTLRAMTLVEEKHSHFNDYFEKRISDHVKINFQVKENHSISLHNLASGRYEICVNLYQDKSRRLYSRSTNSCLYIPWNVPEYEYQQANRFILMIFMILIILFFSTCAFFIYSIYKYIQSRRPKKISIQQEKNDEEHANFLVNQHFVNHMTPLRLLVHRRMHQRYAHRSPDFNE